MDLFHSKTAQLNKVNNARNTIFSINNSVISISSRKMQVESVLILMMMAVF